MSDFKVGDRVRLTGSFWDEFLESHGSNLRSGSIVTITSVDQNGMAYFTDSGSQLYVKSKGSSFLGEPVENEHRPLRVGDVVRLTGTEWAEYHTPGGRGAEVEITRVTDDDSFYEAIFGDGWYTTTRPLRDEKYAVEAYDQWGCELVTPVEDIESGDGVFHHKVGTKVSLAANLTKDTPGIVIRAHRGAHVVSAIITDEQLDELATVLLYIKMERDKLKE